MGNGFRRRMVALMLVSGALGGVACQADQPAHEVDVSSLGLPTVAEKLAERSGIPAEEWQPAVDEALEAGWVGLTVLARYGSGDFDDPASLGRLVNAGR